MFGVVAAPADDAPAPLADGLPAPAQDEPPSALTRSELLEAAQTHLSAGEFDDASRLLHRLADIYPDSAQAHIELARVASRRGSPSEAAAQWLIGLAKAGGRAPRPWWNEAIRAHPTSEEFRSHVFDLARLNHVIPEGRFITAEERETHGPTFAVADIATISAFATVAGASAVVVEGKPSGTGVRASIRIDADIEGDWSVWRAAIDDGWIGDELQTHAAGLVSALLAEPTEVWDRGVPQVIFFLLSHEPTSRAETATEVVRRAVDELDPTDRSAAADVAELFLAKGAAEADPALRACWPGMSVTLLTLALRWSPRTARVATEASPQVVEELLGPSATSAVDYHKRIVLAAVMRPDSLRDVAGNLSAELTNAEETSVSRLKALSSWQPARRRRWRRRLRVAICISGQLRGFATAAKTYANLGLPADAKVVTFVHTWQAVGRPVPSLRHGPRAFRGSMLAEFNRLIGELGDEELWSRLPTLHSWFADSDTVGPDILAEVYATPAGNVVVDDENSEEFASLSNPQKMLRKIGLCHDLARATDDFDLFVRLRPDRTIMSETAIDWEAVARDSAERGELYCDLPAFGFWGWIGIGDQFAVGGAAAMDSYSSTFERVSCWDGEDIWSSISPRWVGHRPLGATVLSDGIVPKRLDGLKLGGFADAPRPTNSELTEALRVDVELGDGDAAKRLLNAVAAEQS